MSKLREGQLPLLDFILVNKNLRAGLGHPPAISREALIKLIKMKVAAGRPEDMLDIQKLQETDR